MSSIEYLRNIYNLHDCEDYDVIDQIIDIISEEDRCDEDAYILLKGRQVHRIRLSRTTPAVVLDVEININLDQDVKLENYNYLDDTRPKSPGKWFADHGFTVRSKIEDGYWIQYAFKSRGGNNLTRTEVIDYLNFANINYDVHIISNTEHFHISRV